jgi:hypothetical protein
MKESPKAEKNLLGKRRVLEEEKGTSEKIRKPWLADEDSFLKELVKEHGCKKWKQISTKLNSKFTHNSTICSPKQCRERYQNCLNPELNKSPWNDYEELVLLVHHFINKNKWAEISKFLPGRNNTTIKNHFYSLILKVEKGIYKKSIEANQTQRTLLFTQRLYIIFTLHSELVASKQDNEYKREDIMMRKWMEEHHLTVHQIQAYAQSLIHQYTSINTNLQNKNLSLNLHWEQLGQFVNCLFRALYSAIGAIKQTDNLAQIDEQIEALFPPTFLHKTDTPTETTGNPEPSNTPSPELFFPQQNIQFGTMQSPCVHLGRNNKQLLPPHQPPSSMRGFSQTPYFPNQISSQIPSFPGLLPQNRGMYSVPFSHTGCPYIYPNHLSLLPPSYTHQFSQSPFLSPSPNPHTTHNSTQPINRPFAFYPSLHTQRHHESTPVSSLPSTLQLAPISNALPSPPQNHISTPSQTQTQTQKTTPTLNSTHSTTESRQQMLKHIKIEAELPTNNSGAKTNHSPSPIFIISHKQFSDFTQASTNYRDKT